MKKLIVMTLSVFMFFGVPFPVYALEQLTETQNVAVEAQNTPQLEETEHSIDGSVNEEEQLPEDIVANIEEPVENAEDLDVLSSEVEREDESSRNDTDIKADEQKLEISADKQDQTNLNAMSKTEPVVAANAEESKTKTASLTIMKDLEAGSIIDPNQIFIFIVTSAPNKYQAEVTIQGTTSITIEGLEYGAYCVQEKTYWSWRYEVNNIVVSPVVAGANDEFLNGKIVGKNVALSAAHDDVTITFKNQKTNDNWLSGDSFAINLYGQANNTDAVVYFKEEDDES